MAPKKAFLSLAVLVCAGLLEAGHAQSSHVAFGTPLDGYVAGDILPPRPVVEDINQDGDLDVGITVAGQAVNFPVFDGLGGFPQVTDLPVPFADGVGSADLNRDGTRTDRRMGPDPVVGD